MPSHEGRLIYRCLGCGREYGIEKLVYTCPECHQVLLIYDQNFDRLKTISGALWQRIFDYRKMLNIAALKGIYRYHEFIGPVLPLETIIYLGEGHTPLIAANQALQEKVGVRFYFKNDGQNPSASFKDRGMASALSYINFMVRKGIFQMYWPSAPRRAIHRPRPLFMHPICSRRSSQRCCCRTRK